MKKTIRYLYLLYALYGLFLIANKLVVLFVYVVHPSVPTGVSVDAYSTLFYLKESVYFLIGIAFFVYGGYGIIHQEGRTKAAYYVPLWFEAMGGTLLFILRGLSLVYCATPETTSEYTSYWLRATYLDPIYLVSFIGGILLIRAYQREDKGQSFLRLGYSGLACLLPMFFYELTLFALDIINSRSSVLAIVGGTLLYAFRLTILILSFFALKEADE
jgi:hypothetical protein